MHWDVDSALRSRSNARLGDAHAGGGKPACPPRRRASPAAGCCWLPALCHAGRQAGRHSAARRRANEPRCRLPARPTAVARALALSVCLDVLRLYRSARGHARHGASRLCRLRRLLRRRPGSRRLPARCAGGAAGSQTGGPCTHLLCSQGTVEGYCWPQCMHRPSDFGHAWDAGEHLLTSGTPSRTPQTCRCCRQSRRCTMRQRSSATRSAPSSSAASRRPTGEGAARDAGLAGEARWMLPPPARLATPFFLLCPAACANP